MNLIIPMAGMGKRLRPHTLTTPKPLIPIAGKFIVQHLIEELMNVCNKNIDNIGFIIGDFGKEVEDKLLNLALQYNAKGHIFYQHEALGTAHAINCASKLLQGETIIAFADTIFYADFKINPISDAIIWVKEVEDPSAFGVVKVNDDNVITDFIEKSKTFISNKAIIGIYYFKDALVLKNEIEYLISNNIKGNNEFQLTDALENMKNKGFVFTPAIVNQWLDCGNKNATVLTNKAVLSKVKKVEYKEKSTVKLINSIIIEPCYIGSNVIIENSIVGPFISLEDNTSIINSVVSNSIILSKSTINNQNFTNSMIGNHVSLCSQNKEFNLGDYNIIE